MNRAYYSDSIHDFLVRSSDEILGILAKKNTFSLESTQRDSWEEEIRMLKEVLIGFSGYIYFEYAIPRMSQRIDVLLLIESVLFVLEFKVGENNHTSSALDQVMDYALDLKNFHETSHSLYIAPILIPTKATIKKIDIELTGHGDKVFHPIKAAVENLQNVLKDILLATEGKVIDQEKWESGRYQPTPTIIEAATALYNNHSVEEISRNDAGAKNLTLTTGVVADLIAKARSESQRLICFVTGVPGAGKTLVGLNITTTHFKESDELYSVFLSGNGPLVSILREALTRNNVYSAKQLGERLTKKKVFSKVKAFVQNVHNFRDECIKDKNPPIEHVVLFDEAQRAWNLQQTTNFMHRKKKIAHFQQSEPEFLISCMDRHLDWAVIVCLVGGGQEINTGEAGISEWIEALNRSYPDWNVHVSSRLTDSEYAAGQALELLKQRNNVYYNDSLHLATSMRSFRAENVSNLVKCILDLEFEEAFQNLNQLNDKYPIVITRDLNKARRWLRNQARGTERFGIVASSQASRLKPHAIDIRVKINPVHWFLNNKEDVRSSYYLEDAASEFDVQGLELDWACVTWDGDFRRTKEGWGYWSFKGSKWQRIKKEDRKSYLKNAYRVLLTRARQGMVIVVPNGDLEDPTRDPKFYDPTFEYLQKIGFQII